MNKEEMAALALIVSTALSTSIASEFSALREVMKPVVVEPAPNDDANADSEADATRFAAMEETNKTLRTELDALTTKFNAAMTDDDGRHQPPAAGSGGESSKVI